MNVPLIDSFGYIMIVVSDRQRAIDFYSKLLQKQPDFAGPNWIQFTAGQTIIGLHDPDHWSDPNDPLRSAGPGQKGVSFGLWVNDLAQTMRYLTSVHIAPIHGPRTTGLGKLVYMSDPDGHIIQLCERTSSP